ncbi:methyltransferase domain-containing protein [Pseudoalteromonas rubra]|uniref:methyltransferase domain-containing protein n=1 Tax=Pseudoalteromonas rubra TaxID=43658 RepID=UPI0013DDAD96|nr:methyltransferase domain-containing protein [Pseudoalteromonas rubra]
MSGKNIYIEELISDEQIQLGIALLNRQYEQRLSKATMTVSSIRDNRIRFFGCFTDNKLTAVFGLTLHNCASEMNYSHLFNHLEFENGQVATIGQFAAINRICVKTLYGVLFDTAQRLGLEILYGILTKNETFYIHYLAATIHKRNCDVDVGTEVPVTAFSMQCRELAPRTQNFLRRSPDRVFEQHNSMLKIHSSDKHTSDSDWGSYQRAFSQIVTSVQQQLYREIADQLNDQVMDSGCGPAHLLKFIENKSIEYHGIDQSPLMVAGAKATIAELGFANANAQLGFSEQLYCNGKGFKTICSINSLYAAAHPIKQLKHLANQLAVGGTLWLANPNPNMNMTKMTELLKSEAQYWGAHPLFDDFCQHNLRLVNTYQKNFYATGLLSEWCKSVGLRLTSCSEAKFKGAVSLIKAVKEV